MSGEGLDLVFVSDTHGQHSKLALGEGDILCHCGDFTHRGEMELVELFADFITEQKFKHKVVIAGNHDFCFEDNRRSAAEQILKERGIIYLNDTSVQIEGINFWGSPIQPWFYDWAFNRQRGAEISKHWDLIPETVDVLLTHGPPSGVLDLCADGERAGCVDLLNKVKKIKPRIHAFGHIHEAYGMEELNGIRYINACNLDKNYNFRHSPIKVRFAN